MPIYCIGDGGSRELVDCKQVGREGSWIFYDFTMINNEGREEVISADQLCKLTKNGLFVQAPTLAEAERLRWEPKMCQQVRLGDWTAVIIASEGKPICSRN
jgi:hypothetical protein